MKEIIKFINSTENMFCVINISEDSLVTLVFTDIIPDETMLKSGFYLLNENNFTIQGDYSSYKYIYHIDKATNTVLLTSDSNRIYIESPSGVVTDTPEYTISDEQLLFNTKESKIKEMSDLCQQTIEYGVTIDDKHYTYTIQDQSNLVNAVNLAKTTGMSVPYHADGESCSLYTYEEISKIYINEQMNLTRQQTYFNQLKLYIQSLTTISDKEIIDGIYYGLPLTGTYLEEYDNIIAQSKAIMTAITSATQEV